MRETYTVRAKHWAHGWELHIDDVGVTQSRTLEVAPQVVRDYIATLTDRDDTDDIEVRIVPFIDGELEREAEAAVNRSRAAEVEQREAAAGLRASVAALRDAGLSLTDIAAIVGVSRARVSQLVKSEKVATVAAGRR